MNLATAGVDSAFGGMGVGVSVLLLEAVPANILVKASTPVVALEKRLIGAGAGAGTLFLSSLASGGATSGNS